MQAGHVLANGHLGSSTEIDAEVGRVFPILIYDCFALIDSGFMIPKVIHIESTSTNKGSDVSLAKAFYHAYVGRNTAFLIGGVR